MNNTIKKIFRVVFLIIIISLLSQLVVAAQTSTGPSATASPSAPLEQPFSCSNPQQCKEIDEVWKIIGTNVRNFDAVWDVSKVPFAWRAFSVLYASPAPFVQPGVTLPGLCFPLERNSFASNRDNFGDDRDSGNRCHAGIDLLTHNEARVVAVDNGEIVGLQPSFIDPNEGCGATGAAALLVYHQNLLGVGEVTINYGELLPSDVTSFTVGQKVLKGQFLGRASPCGMLHFEMYEGKVTHTISWDNPPGLVVNKNQCAVDPAFLATKPENIKDPTGFIQSISSNFCGSTSSLDGSSLSYRDTTHLPAVIAESQRQGIDICFSKVVVSRESGGQSDIVGVDAEVPGCEIKSRRLLLMEKSGNCQSQYTTQEDLMNDCLDHKDPNFDRYDRPLSGINDCLDNFLNTQQFSLTKPTKDDFCDNIFEESFSYGIGLGQITPSAGTREITIGGASYTHCDLFDPHKNILALVTLLKKKGASINQDEAQIQEVYQKYAGALTPGVERRVADHLKCRSEQLLT